MSETPADQTSQGSPIDIDLQETLSVLDDIPPGVPLTSQEIAAELGITACEAYQQLMFLVEDGYVSSKKIEGDGRIWWDTRRHDEVTQLTQLVQSSTDGVFVVDDEGLITYANPAFAATVGYTRDELKQMPLSHLVAEGDLASRGEDMPPEMISLVTNDGGTRRLEATTTSLPAADEPDRTGVILRDSSLRNMRERELERQRDRLSTLHNLYAVIHEITISILDRSSRSEIEQTACEHLTSMAANDIAWIGDVDRSEGVVAPQAAAGIPLEELSEIPIDESQSESTVDQVLDRASIEVTPVEEMAVHSGHALPSDRLDQESTIAIIPITTGDVIEGLLFIYSTRPEAFQGFERDVIDGIGEVIGHAIAVKRQRHSLTSGQITEVDLKISDFEERHGVELPGDTELSLVAASPVGDGRYQIYGTTDPEGIEFVEALVDVLPLWEAVEVIERNDAEVRVKVIASEAPMMEAVLNLGGRIEEVNFEDNAVTIRIDIPANTDVRDVVELVKEHYPEAELASTHRIEQSGLRLDHDDANPMSTLTDRQRDIISAAYFNGYYEKPRQITGDELAAEFDIAGATLNEHLRSAEQKIFDEIFSDSTS